MCAGKFAPRDKLLRPATARRGAQAVAALMKVPQLLRPIYIEEATARFKQAVSTDRPFIERITQFWTNHFAVSVDKNLLLGLAGSLEREAIRPNVLGNFGDLLLAVERHPAMLLYLDNHLSVWAELQGGAERRVVGTPSARSASTRTSRAKPSSCTRSVLVAATRRPM